MKHIIDTLIIKLIFLIIIILFLYIFKKLHLFLAPKEIKNIHNSFNPIRNHVDSIHFFSRILSIGVILSSISINVHQDLILNMVNFISWSTISMVAYFISIYTLEGIILHPFEYQEEVHNNKNYTYVLISSFLSICVAFIIKATIISTGFYFLLFVVSYSFLFVIFIALLKLYSFLSIFKLKNNIAKDQISAAFSFGGYIIGVSIVCLFSLDSLDDDYRVYLLQILTKITLAIIIFPIFKAGIIQVFKIKLKLSQEQKQNQVHDKYPQLGYGIFEGAVFCISGIFTSLLMPVINITSTLPV